MSRSGATKHLNCFGALDALPIIFRWGEWQSPPKCFRRRRGHTGVTTPLHRLCVDSGPHPCQRRSRAPPLIKLARNPQRGRYDNWIQSEFMYLFIFIFEIFISTYWPIVVFIFCISKFFNNFLNCKN